MFNDAVKQAVIIIEYPHPQDCNRNQGRNDRHIVQGTQKLDAFNFPVHAYRNHKPQNHANRNTNHVNYRIQQNLPKFRICK